MNSLWKYQTFAVTWKIMREINLQYDLLMKKGLRKKDESEFPHILHSGIKWKIYSHPKNISSNQLFTNFFTKKGPFTRFLQKKCESKFFILSHCVNLTRKKIVKKAYFWPMGFDFTEIFWRNGKRKLPY